MSDYYSRHVRSPRELGYGRENALYYSRGKQVHPLFANYLGIVKSPRRKGLVWGREKTRGHKQRIVYSKVEHTPDMGRAYVGIPNLRLNTILIEEMERMKGEVEILNSRLASIENTSGQELEIKDISFGEAKTAVKRFLKGYLKEYRQVYPSDVAEELGLRYERVREIFDSLEKEGKLKRKGE